MTKETYAPVILGGEGDVKVSLAAGWGRLRRPRAVARPTAVFGSSHDRDSARRPSRMLDLGM